MNTATVQSYTDFTKAHTAPPAPPRTVKVSEQTFSRLCAALNLDASSAEMLDVERELTKLGTALRDKEAGHKLVSVSRRGPL